MRTPTHAQLKTFCESDYWESKKLTDHWRYTKTINGKLWRTRISLGSGQIGDPKLFSHILRDQLNVDVDEFWRVIDHGGPARRPSPPAPPAAEAELPTWLVQGLFKEGVPREEVSKLDEVSARQLLNDIRSRPKP